MPGKTPNGRRQGPQAAPNQSRNYMRPKIDSTGAPRDDHYSLQKKIKPGRIRQDEEHSYQVRGEPEPDAPNEWESQTFQHRKDDLNARKEDPAREGRGPSFLAQIVEAMNGKKMPDPLLARLRTLEPRVLKNILNILKTQGAKAYDPVGPMGTGPLRRLPTAVERKAPGYQGVAPPPGPSERLKMEAKARELSETEAFDSQMNDERKLREQDF